ncbi:MAG: FkbM family methyltransferase [Armatimonadetes bacterium]|nr:FkbM family methyltransferase [Anaerolineae bacterium]
MGRGAVNLIDIGSVGKLPAPWNQHSQRIRHLLKFEPRDAAAQTPHITTLSVALWREEAERDFYIYQGLQGSGSSLYLQNYDYVRDHYAALSQRGDPALAATWFERSQLVSTERLACRTLDTILLEQPSRPYHLLKIDAQGAEYDILRGAEQLLRGDCLALQLELFTLPLYMGIRLLPEVQAYLADFGFALVKQYPAHGTFASQHECVFMKADAATSTVGRAIQAVYGLAH